MIRKLFLTISTLAVFSALALAVEGDIATFRDVNDTSKISIDSSGNLIPRSAEVKLGTSANRWASMYISSFSMNVATKDFWSDLPTASTWAIYSVLTTTKAAVTFGVLNLTQPADARIITFAIGNQDATDACTGSVVVYGRNAKGESVSETVSIAARVTATATVYPYAYISSFTVTTLTWAGTGVEDAMRLDVGTSAKIGLSNDLYTASDIIGVKEGTGGISPGSITVDTTYDTVDFVTDPNGSNEYAVTYYIRKAP